MSIKNKKNNIPTYMYYSTTENEVVEIYDLTQHIILQQILTGMTLTGIAAPVIYLGEL